MTRRAPWLGTVLIAVALAVAGVLGAVSYGQDYNLRRGFGTLVQFKRAGTGRLEEVRFYSRALDREADYLVYLPPHWTAAKQYPAYYLLHGSPGKPQVFVDIANMDIRLDNQMALGHSRPMILVYPDGRIDHDTYSDSEWANTPSGNYAGYVLDVVHDVDEHFSAIPDRTARVIGGFSAGAFGAINIALHYPNVFANVQSWSGYFTETPTAVFTHASPALLDANSPVDYIRSIHAELRRDPLRAYLFVGRDDSSYAQQAPMVRQLIAAGVGEQHAVYPGGHDWGVWYPRLNQMLDMASFDVAHPPRWLNPAHLRATPRAAPAPDTAPRSHARAGAGTGPRHRHHHHSELALIGSLLLALISAALINIGFVLQHRGHAHTARRRQPGRLGVLSERTWLIGQGIGWLGFAGQVLAVALAPLTLVQAFSAGSLALSVPVAAAAFGHRVSRRQALAISAIAICLVTLPIGFGHTGGTLSPGILLLAALGVLLADAVLVGRRSVVAQAVLAGAFYGVADAAIKAESIGLRFHHGSIFTGWTLLAVLGTYGGFIAFQTALAAGDPVRPLSLMNAVTAVAAIALGVAAFGEALGSNLLAGILHLVAIGGVFVAASVLAGAEVTEITTDPDAPGPDRAGATETAGAPLTASAATRRPVLSWVCGVATGLGGALTILLGCIVAIGLLYGLRTSGLFSIGPRITDALPLLQLAGFAAQPLSRVIAAGLLAGVVLGVALNRVDRRRRVAIVLFGALAMLLLGTEASTALARNLRLSQVMLHTTPGLGPWLAAVLMAGASAGPGRRLSLPWPATRHSLSPRRWLGPAVVLGLAAIVAAALVTPSGQAATQPTAAVTTRPSGLMPLAHIHPTPLSAHSPLLPHPADRRGGASRSATLAPGRARRADVLDDALALARRRFHTPAATAALVVCGQTVWAGASGIANLATGARVTNRSLFIQNSAVKTIVATMVLKEIQDHRLSLDTSLARFYPGLPDARAITVRMLLDMTSGLPEYLANPAIEALAGAHPEHAWSTLQLLTGLGRGLGHILFRPGSRYDYSDTNYIALGGILTTVTHRPLQSLFETLIARPLGLTSATWARTAAATATLARPYALSTRGRITSKWIHDFGPATVVWGPVFTDGGLAATSVDLARFANGLLAGRLLHRASLAAMTHLGRGGYGLGIRAKVFDGRSWLGHTGAFSGYDSEDWTDPRRQLTLAVSANLLGHSGGLISNSIWQELARVVDRLEPTVPSCASHSALARAGL